MNDLELVQGFHIAFLTALAQSADIRGWALKGGGNMRFFYGSRRFSEDIDLDATGAATFTRKVERAFESTLMQKQLAAIGTRMTEFYPKDRSDTKERWNLKLVIPGVPVEQGVASTKIEISYRPYPAIPREIAVERIDSNVMATYGGRLVAPQLTRYLAPSAVGQKIIALSERSATQPRDAYDLDHLWKAYPDALAKGQIDPAIADSAAARLVELTYGQYEALVGSFLDPDYAGIEGTEEHWNAIQTAVLGKLMELGS